VARPTLCKWVGRYGQDGVAGLRAHPRAGTGAGPCPDQRIGGRLPAIREGFPISVTSAPVRDEFETVYAGHGARAACGSDGSVRAPICGLATIAVAIPIAPVAVAVPIPAVVVLEPASVTLPVAVKETLPIVTRRNPACTAVGRPRPVSFMPPVTVAYWIPVTIHPKKIRSRCRRPHSNHPRRRRRTNPYSNRYLAKQSSPGEQEYGKQFSHHFRSFPLSYRRLSVGGRPEYDARSAATTITLIGSFQGLSHSVPYPAIRPAGVFPGFLARGCVLP